MLMTSNYLSQKVEESLGSRDYGQLLQDVLDPAHVVHVQAEGMELITMIVERGLRFAEDNDSIRVISQCLNHVVCNYKPKESLICLLEQGEAFVNSDKFTYLLPPLQYVMMQLPKKREKTFSWVLSILKSHMKHHLRLPEDVMKQLSTDDSDQSNPGILLEQDPQVRRILQTYLDYIDFYSPFANDLATLSATVDTNNPEEVRSICRQRQYLRDYLVDLLGIPLVHFDLSYAQDTTAAESIQTKTEARVVAEKLMDLLRMVDQSPLDYLKWIEDRMAITTAPTLIRKPAVSNGSLGGEEDESDEDEEEIIVHMSSLVSYLYLIFDQCLPVQKMSRVFSPTYIFRMILYPVTTVLKNINNTQAVMKAIRLASKVLTFCDMSPCKKGEYNYDHRLHKDVLQTEIHRLFIDRVLYAAVYCTSRGVRQQAYGLFQQYFEAFDPFGKYEVLQHLFHEIPSDTLMGHAITQLKQCIFIASDKNHRLHEIGYEECFLGDPATRLILKVCHLEHGETTAIWENSDRIISALNMLRFLLLRSKTEPRIGIAELFPQIEKGMLHPLRKGLDLSKAHYELKLKELNDPHSKESREREEIKMFEDMKCDVEINGETVKAGDISLQEQKSTLINSLNAFHHMSGLLVMVNEAHAQASKP